MAYIIEATWTPGTCDPRTGYGQSWHQTSDRDRAQKVADRVRAWPVTETVTVEWDGHTADCVWFTDMDGSEHCTCGGEQCDSGFSMGPDHDPYGVHCQYIRRDHPRDDHGRLLHAGDNPLPAPGEEVIEWTGGGYCVGDPLPYHIVRTRETEEASS